MKIALCILSLLVVGLTLVCVWLLRQLRHIRQQVTESVTTTKQSTDTAPQDAPASAEKKIGEIASPVIIPKPTQKADGALVKPLSDKPKRKIVVVDDSADSRKEMAFQLASDFEVLVAEDGKQGLALVRDQHPVLVVSSVRMPVMTGYELCHAIREDTALCQIPVILVSALSERENIIYGLEAGADDYIVKPYDVAILRTRIMSILKRNKEQMDKVLGGLAISKREYKDRQDKMLMDKVIGIIKKHLSDSEFTINDLCLELGMSRSSTFGKIKVLTGHGPKDLIKAIRMDEAHELLLTHELNVGEVAYRVGFSDPKYFSTCFKKQFGISPTKI